MTGERKRFYKDVSVTPASESDKGFGVLLDGRRVRTPAKRELSLPNIDLAEALADEWRRQGASIAPGTMPLTRITNSAIDGVSESTTEVRSAILAYGGSDLVCYFADGPAELIERQQREWGVVHAWMRESFGVALRLANGIMPVEQPREVLEQLELALGSRTVLELAALHVITSSMGSLVLALAVLHGRLSAHEAWRLAHIDEDFQIEKWGQDGVAAERREAHWREVEAAGRILAACRAAEA